MNIYLQTLTLCLITTYICEGLCFGALHSNNFVNHLKITFVTGNTTENSNAWYQQIAPLVHHDKQLLEK